MSFHSIFGSVETVFQPDYSQGNYSQSNYCVVLVTAASREEAETIATALVTDHLAACVSLTTVHSIYTWQGQVHREEEWQLIIKSKTDQFEALASRVRSLHSYEVPEIIALPIVAGSQPYLNWIAEQTNPSSL